jgi:hypothetical protein
VVRSLGRVARRDRAVLATARTPDPVVVPLSAAALLLGGFALRNATVAVDGTRVGSVGSNGSANPGIVSLAGYSTLEPGVHTVTVRYGDSWVRPGATAPAYSIGPVIFAPVTGVSFVTDVAPAHATRLCGQSLDWIEVVKS